MGDFSTDWLTLREPYDHAARSEEVLEPLRGRLPNGFRGVELGCGTGSGVRWLNERLPGGHWTLVDHDPDLLAAVPDELGTTHHHDLQQLESLDLPADVVTCQALLDLVSEDWLVRFADWLEARAVPLLAALTVDGRVTWTPVDPEDDAIEDAFRAHQLTDRGFGASPGHQAAVRTVSLLAARGFALQIHRADWTIGRSSPEMLREMVRGHAHAAGEVLGDAAVAGWLERRLEHVAQGVLELSVGHLDLLATPQNGR